MIRGRCGSAVFASTETPIISQLVNIETHKHTRLSFAPEKPLFLFVPGNLKSFFNCASEGGTC